MSNCKEAWETADFRAAIGRPDSNWELSVDDYGDEIALGPAYDVSGRLVFARTHWEAFVLTGLDKARVRRIGRRIRDGAVVSDSIAVLAAAWGGRNGITQGNDR